MKNHKTILTTALLGIALAASNINPASMAAGQGDEASMTQAYGFASHMPADTASYSAFFNLGKAFDDLEHSKMWASISANPIVSKELNDKSFQAFLSESKSDPDAAKLKAILEEALGTETFIALAPGSEAKVHAWVELNSDLRMARLQALLTGNVEAMNSPNVIMSAILPHLKDLDIPPMILGFKVTTQKAALDSELAKAEKALPPFVEQSTFTLGANQPFKSLSVTVEKALPEEQRDSMKMMASMFISDPQAAQTAYNSLLSRKIEIAYGYVGDYFIISIGPDHSHLKFADTYAASLLGRPDVQKAAAYTGKSVVSFSWASQQMMEACRQGYELMPAYEGLKSQLADSLSPSDIAKIESDIKRIDTEGRAFFNLPATSMVGIEYLEHGLYGEIYGGFNYGVPSSPMKFSGVPKDSTFIWMDQMVNPALREAARVWIEDFASTSWDTFLRIGLPHMPESERQYFGMAQNIFVPKFVEFYKITRDEFTKSLGQENAFAVDLNGEIPDTKLLQPEFHANGKMFRLAFLNDLQDRALLAKSWDSYFKFASDLALMAPGEQFANGLPKPVGENADGIALWYYDLEPTLKGDFTPNVAVTDKTFVASSSRAYSLEISKAAAGAAPSGKVMNLDLRVNFKPLYDLADKWLAFAAQDPDVFFTDDEDEAEDFKKSEPDVVSLINSLRPFEGVSVQVYQEDGVPRVSSQVRFEDK